MGGYIAPPLKTRFWEGITFPDHAVADFRKKVRVSHPKDGPEGGGDFRDNMVWKGDTLLKNPKIPQNPHFFTFFILYLYNFFPGAAMGGYTGPPLKTRFWEGITFPDHAIADFRKKCAPPPRRMVQREWGDFRTFFSKIGDNMVWKGDTLLKKWPKRAQG